MSSRKGRKIKPRFPLDSYQYPVVIMFHLNDTVNLIERGQYHEAEKEFGRKAIEILKSVKKGMMEPSEADKVFTLLDTFVSDNYISRCPDKKFFRSQFFDLLMEGMHLHHFGDKSGWAPSLEQMIDLANELLD